MRHYEIVLLMHPDQSDQVESMIDRYEKTITDGNGFVHRKEDWGRKVLAYPINKIYKAHYILLNIECDNDVLKELESNFRFNDAVIRSMTIKRKSAVQGESFMMIKEEKRDKAPKVESAPINQELEML